MLFRASADHPGTPAYRSALRDAIVSTKELAGTHGIYNFKPDNRYGSDQRAVVIVRSVSVAGVHISAPV